MVRFSIFVVDDEPTIREGMLLTLEEQYDVRVFSAAEPALQAMKAEAPDLVLLDICLPGISGLEALERMRNLWPGITVIMITAYEDIDTVIAAMKLGAYDYVVKPLHMDSLEIAISNALEAQRLRKEVRTLQEKYLVENLPCFIGESDAIVDVMGFMETVARSPDTPILIQGETGTGKEWIAGAIHYRSPNFRGPLVTVNCAAIPRELIESELFGYEKGAFSGAAESGKKGRIEAAASGTLFLDEVGDLGLEAQAKLLRFFEDGEFYRIGGTRRHRVKTRVVSATNKDLKALIHQGSFRKDLYYRLSVIRISLPSLEHRREDILPLAKHFLVHFADKFGKTFTGISQSAVAALKNHRWEGNVRELKNVIERGVLTGSGPVLEETDLGIGAKAVFQPYQVAVPAGLGPLTPGGMDLDAVLSSVEKFYIDSAFLLAGGSESQAARLLKLNHHTFRYRRKKYLKQVAQKSRRDS